jgi:cytochrome d ubiquinol oxidase subunit II
VSAAAAATLALALSGAPQIGHGLAASPWALPLHGATAAAAVVAIGALWRRRYRLARLAAAGQVSLILWGWATAQYPYLVPPTLTIAEAAAPSVTLSLVLWAVAAGALVLFPSLAYLLWIFKRQPRSPELR